MAVAAGGIAFVAYSFDNYNAGSANLQGFAFVALEPIAAGEQIRFVDGRWSGTALAIDSEVTWTNTTGAAIGAGTVIEVTLSNYSGTANNDAGGFTAATANTGAVTAPSALWNIDTTDSLYAVTSASGTAPGTTVAAVLWGTKTATNLTAGASLLDPGTAASAIDTASINTATVNTPYASAPAARTAYTAAGNWVFDDDASDDAGYSTSPDWPPLTDTNSPLAGRSSLSVSGTTNGTTGADTLTGDAGKNAIVGDNGADSIRGGDGDDLLYGDDTAANVTGDGNDTILGEGGNDTVIAGGGNDSASGGIGNDYLGGGAGLDTLDGGDGNDTLVGGDGNDSLVGGAGTDFADYTAATAAITVAVSGANLTVNAGATLGTDTLSGVEGVLGGAGADTMSAATLTTGVLFDGGAGADAITGGAGNDSLFGGAGIDTLDGGAGNDTLVGGADNDSMVGGAGFDTADYSVAPVGISVAVNGANLVVTATGAALGTDTLVGVEAVLGGDGADTLNAATFTTALLLDGAAGADTLTGGTANDTLVGGTGADSLTGNAGADSLDGGADNDVLLGGAGGDTLSGGDGADNLDGGDDNDTLAGGAGDDTISGGAGTDTVDYSTRTAGLSATSTGTTFTVNEGTGTDSVSLVEAVLGGAGDDTINAGAHTSAMQLSGGAGNDALTGGSGADTLIGGAGDDTLTGGAGADTVQVSGPAAGYNVVFGQDAGGSFALVTDTDTANGSDGADKIYGAETLRFSDGTTRNLAVTQPTIAFGDANGAVNGTEANGTPVTISGLAAGETAVVTFRSSAGSATATATFTANGTVNANVSGLGDGTVTVSQIAVTSGANTNTFANPTAPSVTLDKTLDGATPVSVTLTDAQVNASEAAATPFTVSGLDANTTATITFRSSGGAATTTATVGANGSGTVNLSALPDGTVTVASIALSDASGNTGAASPGDSAAALDKAGPTVSGVAYGANDGALAAGEAATLVVSFSESVTVAGGTPTLSLNSGGTATYVGGSGTGALTFSYTPAAGQSAADLAVTAFNPNGATLRDAAGNGANTAGAVRNPDGTLAVDTAAPTAAPAIGAVTDNVGGIVGTVAPGGSTDDNTPTVALSLSGTGAAAGDTVALFANGAQVASKVLASADITAGSVDLTASALATDGAKTFTATITDAAGNASAASGGVSVTLDRVAPTATTTIRLASDTGSSGADGVTSDAALTGTVSGLGSGTTVTVFDGATAVGTAQTGGGGVWTFTPTGGAASEGGHSYTARVSDAAGNLGPASDALPVTLDRTAPTATATVALASDTGASGTDGATANPALAGTGPANGTIVISDGGVVVGTVTAGPDGAWSFANGGASDGAHSYTVRVADAAGNLGPASGALSVTVDTQAPGTAPTIALASDTGAAGDGLTSSAALTGTGPANGTVVVSDGGTVLGTAATDADGAWTFTPTGAAAAEGAHSYTARAADAAGNLGPASEPVAVTLDRTADADVALDLTDAAAAADDAAVEFTLAGLDAGSTAAVTFTGSAGGSVTRTFGADGAQTADVSGLQGDVSATVRVTDAAGNAADGQGDALLADPVCFMPGTLVATPGGERAVETLRAGDLVLTAGVGAKPVRWLGRQTVSTRFADPMRVLPIRITAGALGENLPRRDLLVSPDHALLVDGVLAQAGALVNGTTIRREAAVPEVFTYWHVELADHSLVLAEGVAAETFIDNVARLAFDNWAEHAAAAEPAPIAELALPRAKSARQVPQATRRRLAARAAALLGAHTAAA